MQKALNVKVKEGFRIIGSLERTPGLLALVRHIHLHGPQRLRSRPFLHLRAMRADPRGGGERAVWGWVGTAPPPLLSLSAPLPGLLTAVKPTPYPLSFSLKAVPGDHDVDRY